MVQVSTGVVFCSTRYYWSSTNFSGTDESVLLRFAKVPERIWVALFVWFLCVCVPFA